MKSKWPRLSSPKKQKNDPPENHHIDPVEISQISFPETEVPSSQTTSKNLNKTSSNESNSKFDDIKNSQSATPQIKGMYVCIQNSIKYISKD